MKVRSILVLALVAISSVAMAVNPVEKVKKTEVLRIASFNLRMDTPNDGENAWPHRKEMVKDLVSYHNFDIFGIQEGFIHMIKGVLELDNYAYLGVGREDGKEKGEYSAIIYKKDRFKVLYHGNFWLSKTPEEVSFGWDAACIRISTWAKLLDKNTDKEFFFFNVHYDHVGKVARRESSKLMLRMIKQIAGDAPCVCTGDFNGTPDCDAIQIMVNDGLLFDSRSVSEQKPYGTEGTFNSFNLNCTRDNRIDYVFVTKGLKVSYYATLNDQFYNHFPSDHFPVLIEAVIK